jgi:hypothetical protein
MQPVVHSIGGGCSGPKSLKRRGGEGFGDCWRHPPLVLGLWCSLVVIPYIPMEKLHQKQLFSNFDATH